MLYKQLKEEALSVTLIDESDYDVPLDKDFNWEITAFKPKSLEIQLNFTEPLAISEGEESDRIKVSFKKTELLYDEYGQALDTGTEIESYVPAQFSSEAEAKFFEAISESFDSMETGAFSSDVIVNLFVSFSLQTVWSMVKA